MKKITFISALTSALLSLTVCAQNQTGQPGTSSGSRNDSATATTNSSSSTGNSKSSSATSASAGATSGLTFTNKQGQSYSVDQLADQLKTLRGTVDQVMPMLQAFNENYSNSATGDRTLTGKLSGLLSDSLHRNESATNSNSTGSSQNSSGKYGNVVDALQGLLSKNDPSAPAISVNTIRDLGTLYGQLQPVNSTLQNLNVALGSGSSNTTNNASGLTPTGKSSGQQ